MRKATSVVLLVIMLHLAAGMLLAGDLSIEGVVTNAETGDPVPYVDVGVKGTKLGDVTDMEGNYAIHGLDPQMYNITTSRIGFRTATKEADLTPGESVTLNFAIDEKALEYGENVIVYGTKMKRTDFDLPINTLTITSDALFERSEWNFMDQAAKETSMEFGGYGPHQWFHIRGYGSNYVLGVVDGTPFPGEEEQEFSMLNTGSIEKVEVLKGPFAVPYGTDAIGGVVAVTTKDMRPATTEPTITGDAMVGYTSVSEGMNANVGVMGSKGMFDLSLRGGYQDHGDYNTPKGTMYSTSYDATELKAKFGAAPLRNHYVSLSYYVRNANDIGNVRPYPDAVVADSNRSIYYKYINKNSADLEYTWEEVAPFLPELSLHGSYITWDRMLGAVAKPYGPDQDTIIISRRLTEKATTNISAEGSFLPYFKLKTVVGVRYLQHMMDEGPQFNRWYDVTSGDTVLYNTSWSTSSVDQPKNLVGNIGFFAQNDYSLLDNLLLSLGVRYDMNSVVERDLDDTENEWEASNAALSGAFGVVYGPLDWLNVSANVGRAFRAPNNEELFRDDVHMSGPPDAPIYLAHLANKELEPEYGISIDGNLKGKMLDDHYTWTASYYYTRLTDAIGEEELNFENDTLWLQMENISKSNKYGFEIEAEAQLPYAITFGGNVSQTWEEYYMENEEGDLEKQPAKHSPVRANLNLKWNFLKKRGWVGTSLQYSDVFIIEMGGKAKKGGDGPPPENIVVDAWKTVDFYAGFNVYKNNFISVSLTNALDEEYSHYSPIYQPGRSINVSLKGGF